MDLGEDSETWLKFAQAKSLCLPSCSRKEETFFFPLSNTSPFPHSVVFCSLQTSWIIYWNLVVEDICWVVPAVRNLMRGVAMKIKEKQRLTDRNPVSESSGQRSGFFRPEFGASSDGRVRMVLTIWQIFLVCSLNVSGNSMRYSDELPECSRQQQVWRLLICDLL